MKILFCFFSVVLNVLICPVYATPWGLPGDAVTRSDNGRLSICMPNMSQGSVGVNSISVSESNLHGGVRLTMWRIELESDGSPMQLKPGDCVLYGVKPSGYQQPVAAKPLEIGGTYYARVNVTVANPVRQSILFYSAVFCMVKQRDGSFVYPQYKYEQSGKTIKPACGKSAVDVSSHYNMEQQGEIVSDYYMICVIGNPRRVWNQSNYSKSPELLNSTLERFLRNPVDKANLPG